MIELHNRGPADVTVGQELAPLTVEVTQTTLANVVHGTRDLYPIHHDTEFARAAGARDKFLNTMWYQGMVGRYITDWAGPEAFLRMLEIRMNGHSCPGDTLTVRGVVTAVRDRLVDLNVSVDNQLQAGATTAQVTVELA